MKKAAVLAVILSVAILPWVAVAQAQAANICADASARLALRKLQAAELLPVIEQGIQTPSPHHYTGGGTLFQSSYDWHSSVHAHWAVLSIAHFIGDSSAEARELARLTPAALQSERSALAENPSFELPYGQSWLLMLLSEIEHTPGASPLLLQTARALHAETLERVLNWLETSAFPESSHSCSGSYDSWSMAFLLLQMSQTVAPSGLRISQRLSALQKRYESGAPTCVENSVSTGNSFVSPSAIAPLLLPSTFSDREFPDPDSLLLDQDNVPITLSNCHELGREITLYWPIAARSGAGQAAACEQYSAFLARALADRRDWSLDFLTESHWLPQFLWFSIWTEEHPFSLP